MVRQSARPASSVLNEIVDRRLARIYGEDALLIVIYPLHRNKDKFKDRDLSTESSYKESSDEK